ncbi:MAG: polymer-forming cytoskeletal protein [Bacteroidota bacterium]|nr:polymer-forming cytoskeletal protein [Bacteroidota bacterium]
MAKYIENEPNLHNTITAGTEIQGDIKAEGDIRLDGTLNGNLYTKGKLVIGESGRVLGEINCKNSDIFGFVEGKLNVADLLSLKATAQIIGTIVTNRLAIEPGCKFSGTCKMINESQNEGRSGEGQPEEQ